jgi:hypothetical protein
MKQEILKLVNLIKDDLRDMEEDGVYHSLIDNIWESLAAIEDEIYEDDSNENDGLDISDYMD